MPGGTSLRAGSRLLGFGASVYYFVIGPDGSQYGPADIDALVRWAQEGRILTSTVLVERGTNRQIRADSLTALAAVLRRVSAGQVAVVVEREARPVTNLPAADDIAGKAGTAPPDEQGAAPPPPPPPPAATPLPCADLRPVGPKSKVIAGLLGIFLGGLGIHRFYLGYTGVGALMLLLSILGGGSIFVCPPLPGAGCGLVWLWGFIEGIICLCGGMRDADGLALRD